MTVKGLQLQTRSSSGPATCGSTLHPCLEPNLCCCDCPAGAAIFAAAQKATANAADSSSKRGQTQRGWLPTLPEACCALLPVLVHTARDAAEGVAAAGQLLLREHEAQQGVAQQQAAAAGRKGKPASSSSRQQLQVAPPSALLSLLAVNGFLAAAVSVVECCRQKGRDEEAESAAEAAVQVAGELFKQQMVAVSLGAAGTGALVLPAGSGPVPDATSWGCLVQLCGVLG